MNILSMILVGLLSTAAFASETTIYYPIKVMEVERNPEYAGGLVLNRHVNHEANPRAYNATVDCASEFDLQVFITDYRDPQNRSSMFSAGSAYPMENCIWLQNQLKKAYRAARTTCLMVTRHFNSNPNAGYAPAPIEIVGLARCEESSRNVLTIPRSLRY